MQIKVLQLNPTVGDILGNQNILFSYYDKAVLEQSDMVVTTECFLSGYPPEDLMLRPEFMDRISFSVQEIADYTKGKKPHLILGTPWRDEGKIYNAILHIMDGKVTPIAYKKYLPDYGVFDDSRIFAKGELSKVIEISGKKFGFLVCEDMWNDDLSHQLKIQGAEFLISLNASPFEMGKFEKRLEQIENRVNETGLLFLATFQNGGQDEIIFDGRSVALSKNKEITFLADPFESKDYNLTLDESFKGYIDKSSHTNDSLVYSALVLALRDYMRKNGFKQLVIGLSGGIDSVLSVVIAVDAIGAENVTAILLPSRYTSEDSYKDAFDTINAIGIKHHIISIEEGFNTVLQSLSPVFEGKSPDLTEENLQSRLRGLYLMAYSNKHGAMLLTTGNKSEMSTGYATIYGDMCGGFNVLKDVYKTQVYSLSEYRNKNFPKNILGTEGIKIPENVIKKAPTAELRDNQKDSDSLPEYDILDKILEHIIEDELSSREIIAKGFDEKTVHRVRHLLDINEYKRYQSAVGGKITSKAFGKDRRYPMTNKFRG